MANDKLPATKTIKDELQEDVMQEVLEAILPKVKPMIKPALARFKTFMKGDGDKPQPGGRKILINIVNGEAHIFVLKNTDIESFSLIEGAEPEDVYPIEQFVEMILSGQFK